MWRRGEEYQVIGPGVVTRFREAAASAGMCSVWQTWHAVSGPPWWWCRNVPPAAKKSNIAQPSTANARCAIVPLEMITCEFIILKLSLPR